MSAAPEAVPTGDKPRYTLSPSERKMGQFLLEQRIISADDLKKAIEHAARENLSFQASLIKLNLVRPEALAMALSASDGSGASRIAPAPAEGPATAPPERPAAPAEAKGPKRKLLGDYLVETGVLSGEQLEQALRYSKEKNVMLGAAIVALKHISEEALAEYLVKHQLEQKKTMARQKRLKLGEILLAQNVLAPEKLEEALDHAKKNKLRLGEAVLALGLAREQDVAMALSRQLGLPLVNLTKYPPDPSLLTKIPRRLCEKHQSIPFRLEGKVLTAAMVDPLNIIALDDFQNMTGHTVLPVLCTKSDFERALMAFYGSEEGEDLLQIIKDKPAEGDADVSLQDAAPIILLVNKVIAMANQKGASDIHFDPTEEGILIRFRIDGILRDSKLKVPREAHVAVVSRIKVMCNLDIAETRLPQDGKFRLKVEGRIIDFRVSLIPLVTGEKIVIRLLDQSRSRATIEELGLDPYSEKIFRDGVHAPNGIVLVTGPTGSGKSTTLYSAILELNEPTTNIHTIEDPVEFTLSGITQVSVRTQVGLTFAAALRSFLRQDPDVIIVGEIRDSETASIALKSAMTGHMVLSTLHTNDAISTIDRLVTMGMDRFLIAAATRCILAQRLVRKLCGTCRERLDLTAEDITHWEISPYNLEQAGLPRDAAPGSLAAYKHKGCDHCQEGYKGRAGVYEVLGIDEDIREMIVEGASNREMWEKARASGLVTLRDSALIKVLRGLSTFDEVSRITVTPPSTKRREAYSLGLEGPSGPTGGGGAPILDAAAVGVLAGLTQRLEMLARGRGGIDLGPGLARAIDAAVALTRCIGQPASPADAAREAARRLTRVLGELTEIAAPLAASPQAIDLGTWLPAAVEGIVASARDPASVARGDTLDLTQFRVNAVVDAAASSAWGDPALIERCLLELVANAMAAAAPTGTVRVTTKAVTSAPGMVEICVVDNGGGIDAGLLAQVREPYVTGGGRGLGLGLAIADRMAQAMRGQLEIVSKPGKGCMARLRLPAAAPGT